MRMISKMLDCALSDVLFFQTRIRSLPCLVTHLISPLVEFCSNRCISQSSEMSFQHRRCSSSHNSLRGIHPSILSPTQHFAPKPHKAIQHIPIVFNGVHQRSIVFNSVQQCSTVFHSVQQCAKVFNSVQQCLIVLISDQQG